VVQSFKTAPEDDPAFNLRPVPDKVASKGAK
jgi:hypothetical protein